MDLKETHPFHQGQSVGEHPLRLPWETRDNIGGEPEPAYSRPCFLHRRFVALRVVVPVHGFEH